MFGWRVHTHSVIVEKACWICTSELKRMKEIFSQPTQKWFNDLKFILRKVQENLGILPSNILIFGGGSLLPEIQEILNTGDWEELAFLERPTVKFLSPNDLKNLEDSTKILTSPQNTASILICYEG